MLTSLFRLLGSLFASHCRAICSLTVLSNVDFLHGRCICDFGGSLHSRIEKIGEGEVTEMSVHYLRAAKYLSAPIQEMSAYMTLVHLDTINSKEGDRS